ncbi:YitT family protein [uncultured Allofournierella sp.]|uniref:YitT family protein n=1 Tax=uncultured Allofournierella sp. TaxID=1940258 RepID=UPI00375013E7
MNQPSKDAKRRKLIPFLPETKLSGMEFVRYACLLNLGLVLTAAGIHLFKTPNHFAMGGTSGMSIIMATLWPGMNVGGALFIINGILVVLGLFFLGVKTMGVTIYSSFALSAYVSLFEAIIPMNAPFTQDTMLELVFAVALPAAGSAIVFNVGASTGGTDIVAMILSKYTSMEIGRALLLSDLVIAMWAGGLYGIATGLYCTLGTFAKAFMVDSVIESLNQRKVVTIITSCPQDVKEFILTILNRSATVYEAEGAYTGRKEQVFTTVLTRRQAVLLRNHLRRVDPHAFLTIVNSSEIVGKGFRAL